MRKNGRQTPNRPAQIRCAIYTRKSHEDGLEQDFNSLDAQREACEAYIRSQIHEGWTALPAMYDDGGISGATLERPALQRLLDDVRAGRIDTVVVYKVDRLTRSLGDFAKIVDVFDAQGVSFVSVTQQFNTTTSMGRLTLNMLLSFAQFEREVTGERIRDKIASSKQKGMWMGGLPPLGYDVADRKLVVNEAEAETVRHIFRRYADLGSVNALKDELDRDGIVSKTRLDKYGRTTGGKPLARGALYLMLQNRIYRGEIVHKENSYPGLHEPIIGEDLWDTVRRKLTDNRTDRETGASADNPSLLAGLIHDDSGARMTPSHANKRGRRYRYYVSQKLVRGTRRNAPQGRRVPAEDVERLVEKRLCRFLGDDAEMFGAIEATVPDAHQRVEVMARAAETAAEWNDLSAEERRAHLLRIVERIDLLLERIDIHVLPDRLSSMNDSSEDRCGPAVTLSVAATLKRTGMETRMLIDGAGGEARRKPDHSLCRVLGQARRFQTMVMRNDGKTIGELAAEAGVGSSYFTRVLRLSFLAPDIVSTILRGQHPLDVTAKGLTQDSRLPLAWEDQRVKLGLGS
jgi:DNA invertase Pin-like site-specific DNA recombinase